MDHSLFKHEAMLAKVYVLPDKRLGTYIGSGAIAERLGLLVEPGSNLVEPEVGDRDEEAVILRGEVLGKLFVRNNWKSKNLRLVDVLSIDGETHDLVLRIMSEVLVGDLRERTCANQD